MSQQQKRPNTEEESGDSKKAKTTADDRDVETAVLSVVDTQFLEQLKEPVDDPTLPQQLEESPDSEDEVRGIEFWPELAESAEFEEELAKFVEETGNQHPKVDDLSDKLKEVYKKFIFSVCNLVCENKASPTGTVFEGLTEFGRHNGLKVNGDAGCLIFANKFRPPSLGYDVYQCRSNFSNVKDPLRIVRRNTAEIKNPQAELYVVYGRVNLCKDKDKQMKPALFATNFWGIVDQ